MVAIFIGADEMSKNHYIKLEKNDLLFVNSEKGDIKLFIFDGKGFTEFGKVKTTIELENDYSKTTLNDEGLFHTYKQ